MISTDEIQRYLPHRYPLLFIDRVLELDEKSIRIVAQKNVSHNEPFFQGHFPGRPVMPGVLIVEALAQAGILCLFALELTPLDADIYFAGFERVKFRKVVVPGDQLRLDVKLLRSRGKYWKMDGVATVDDKTVAEGILSAIIQPT